MHLENVADLIVGLYLERIDFDGELICSMRKLLSSALNYIYFALDVDDRVFKLFVVTESEFSVVT